MQTLLSTCAITIALTSATGLTVDTQLHSPYAVQNVYVGGGGHDNCCDDDCSYNNDCHDDCDHDCHDHHDHHDHSDHHDHEDDDPVDGPPSQCAATMADCVTDISEGCYYFLAIGSWNEFLYRYDSARGLPGPPSEDTCVDTLDICEFDYFYQCITVHWGADYNHGDFATMDEMFHFWDKNNDCCLDHTELTTPTGMSWGEGTFEIPYP